MSSMKFKSQIAPKGLQFYPSEFFISDKYATILTVVSFPKFISPGYLSSLTSMPGIKIVIKHIPLPFSVVSKMLNKQIADLKIKYQEERDRTMQEKIRMDYESLESFVTMLAGSQAKIFDFQMHVMITADTKEELELRKTSVKSYLDAMEMRGVALRFEQEKALKSIIPIFPKQDIEDRIGTPIPSVTIAAMYPFIFDSVKDPGYSALLGSTPGPKNSLRPFIGLRKAEAYSCGFTWTRPSRTSTSPSNVIGGSTPKSSSLHDTTANRPMIPKIHILFFFIVVTVNIPDCFL